LSVASAGGGNGGVSGGGGGGAGGGGGGGGSGRGWHGLLWVAYLSQLERNPVATKSVTCGVLNGFGDVLAQIWLGEEGDRFEWKRLGIFTLLGTVFIGPVLHVWYGLLAKMFTGAGTVTAVSKLAMDQLLFAPVFIGSIISLIMVMEGHGDQVKDKLNSDLFTIVKSNWALWVPFNFLNFRYVPTSLQVGASNVVALLVCFCGLCLCCALIDRPIDRSIDRPTDRLMPYSLVLGPLVLQWNTYVSWASHSDAGEKPAK